MKSYMEENEVHDMLVNRSKDNPLTEQGACNIL